MSDKEFAAWEKDPRGRDVSKIYKLGVGKDAKRQRKTDAEKQVAYRAKKKQLSLINKLCSAPLAAQTPAPFQPEPLATA